MMLKSVEKKVKDLKEFLDPKKRERERKKQQNDAMKKGLAIGTLIGGLTGIFFAPDTGENTRKKTKVELEKIKANLQENISEGKEKLEGNLLESKEKVVEFYENKKEILNNQIATLKEKGHCQLNMAEEDELELPMEELVELVEEEI